jgi:hypothetical protein
MKFSAYFIGLLFVSFVWSCAKRCTPAVYEIPDGYIGWVTVEYGRLDAPPLPIVDGKRVLRIGVRGELRTSSLIEYGIRSDTYRYTGQHAEELPKTNWGGGGMVWAGSVTAAAGGGDHAIERFFVGTEEEYQHAIGRTQ